MYASKKYALGVCDMCGQVYKLKNLLKEIYNQRPTGFLVCIYCWDEDNPQLQLGRTPIVDPQAIENPRPDANLLKSRELWGWNPVGNQSILCQAPVTRVYVNGVKVGPPPIT